MASELNLRPATNHGSRLQTAVPNWFEELGGVAEWSLSIALSPSLSQGNSFACLVSDLGYHTRTAGMYTANISGDDSNCQPSKSHLPTLYFLYFLRRVMLLAMYGLQPIALQRRSTSLCPAIARTWAKSVLRQLGKVCLKSRNLLTPGQTSQEKTRFWCFCLCGSLFCL